MQDLELYRLTPLFWFDVSLSNRKNLIIEFQGSKCPFPMYGRVGVGEMV